MTARDCDGASVREDDYTLLTREQAAERLTIGVQKLDAIRHRGEIGYLRLDNQVRFRPAHLRAYIDACEVPARTRPAGVPGRGQEAATPRGSERPEQGEITADDDPAAGGGRRHAPRPLDPAERERMFPIATSFAGGAR